MIECLNCFLVKALKEGHSTYTMRRIFDSAKEEFQQLEELRDVSSLELSLRCENYFKIFRHFDFFVFKLKLFVLSLCFKMAVL